MESVMMVAAIVMVGVVAIVLALAIDRALMAQSRLHEELAEIRLPERPVGVRRFIGPGRREAEDRLVEHEMSQVDREWEEINSV